MNCFLNVDFIRNILHPAFRFDKFKIHYARIYCSIPVPPLQHGEGHAV